MKPSLKNEAVIYTRVSTKEQASNLSLQVQEAACREYCAKNGWAVAEVFSEAESAKSIDRAEFQKMLEYCVINNKTVAALVVYDATRFSRETMDALYVEGILNAKGVLVRSATQPFDETPAGGLIKTIIYAYGTFENKMKALKTQAGMRAAIRKGLWVHKAPLGFRNVEPVTPDAANLAHDPERAPLIRLALELFGSGEYEKWEVLKRVTALGLRDTSGRPLTPQSFDNMLRNPVYGGWIVGSLEPTVVMDPKNWTRNWPSLSSVAAWTMKEIQCPEPARTIRRA